MKTERRSQWWKDGILVRETVDGVEIVANLGKNSEELGINLPPAPSISAQPEIEGPGTELKRLLYKFGLYPAPNCKCSQHIQEMNKMGVQWCIDNTPKIVGWLREEAERAKLPFTQIGAKILVKRAIHNAKKKLTLSEQTT